MISETYLDYSDVLLKPRKAVVDSRNDVDLNRRIFTKHSKRTVSWVPIIVSNMDSVGTTKMSNFLHQYGMMTALHKYHDLNELHANMTGQNQNFFLSFGMEMTSSALKQFVKDSPCHHQYVMLDVANGYISKFVEYIGNVRELLPDAVIVAGNIATPDMIKEYDDAGADIIKVGIGPGGQCRTRETAGVGVPQLSAVIECAQEAHSRGMHIIADGGINEFADFAKAFSAGADFVMAGSMFAGYDESGGQIEIENGIAYKTVYGMSSHSAMKKYGNQKEYRASEGRTSRVPYKGPIRPLIQEILGSLRSAITYSGVSNLNDLIAYNGSNLIRVQNTINQKYMSHTVGH